MMFAFGPFELDLAACKLRRDGRKVPLQPRVYRTLRYLIEHRDRVVSRAELIDALWGGRQLNGVAVPWAINRVRKALGDQSNGGGFIETVRGHGYRFVAELRESGEATAGRAETPTPLPSRAQEPVHALAARPFVGRSSVIQQLTAALDAAAKGRGGAILLSGEAGIGKTRCAEELAIVARRRGLQVWVGRCFEHGVAPAFWPFIQIMRAVRGDASLHEKVRDECQALLLEIEPRGPGTPRRPVESSDERFWLLDRLCRWLCRTTKGQLRVIVLEDLHCADESSLQALSLLAPLLAQSRLLVVATARDCATNTRSAAELASRMRPCEHVELLGLHSNDVESYLRAVLGEALATQLGQALYAKTTGNPLFLLEVAHVVNAQYERDGRVEVDAVQLPAAVAEVISARVHELPPPTRALLDAAAVIGEEFDVSVLSRVRKLSAKDILSDLQAAAQVRIIAPRPDGSTHAFAHPLMREVLYNALSAAQRADLHAEVGLALEALGVMDPPLSALAYHFHHAPLDAHYARAARYGRAAGDAAMDALAYDEAARNYAWALEAQARAAPEDVASACELLLVSAFALSLARRSQEARKQCARAIELATEAKLSDILITSARLLRPSVWLAHVGDPLALQALETALQMLPEDARAQRSRVYAQLASLPPYSTRLATSRKLSAEAVRLASDSADPVLSFQAQRSRLFGLCGADSITEQLHVAEEMLRFDQGLTWRWVADAHFARYHAFMQRGDAAAAERALDAYTSFATARRMRLQTWHCERLRAQRLLDAGHLDAAERRFRELSEGAQRLCDPLGSAYYYSAQLQALNFERNGKRLPSELKAPPQSAAWAQRLPAHCAQRMQFAIELGQLDQAKREFSALAADDFAAVSDNAFGLYTLVQLVGVSIALSEFDAMRRLRRLLEPHASLIALSPLTLSRGCVARYLGQLEVSLGRWDEAREYFGHASEVNSRSAHELQRLHALLGLAECLGNGRAQSERKQARTIAASVSAAAENFGAFALASTANDVERRLGTEQRRSVPSEVRRVTRRGHRP